MKYRKIVVSFESKFQTSIEPKDVLFNAIVIVIQCPDVGLLFIVSNFIHIKEINLRDNDFKHVRYNLSVSFLLIFMAHMKDEN